MIHGKWRRLSVARIALCLLIGCAERNAHSQSAFAYSAVCKPAPIERNGAAFVPATFLSNETGARVKRLPNYVVRVTHFGRILDFVVGETMAHVNGKPVMLPASPIVIDDLPYLPMAACAQALGFTAEVKDQTVEQAVVEIVTTPTRVTAMRYGVAAEHVRVVLEVSAPCAFQWKANSSLSLTIPGATADSVTDALGLMDVLLRQVSHANDAGGGITRWVVHTNYRVPAEVFTLSEPNRIAVELTRVFEESSLREVAPGVALRGLRRGTALGPLVIWSAEIDVNSRAFDIAPALAPNGSRQDPSGGFGLEPTSAIAAREGALLAINGGYFGPGTGPALGTVFINGQWVRPPVNGRACLCIFRDGSMSFENLKLSASLKFGNLPAFPITDLNTRNNANGIIAFTPQWVGEVPVKVGQFAALVQEGRVAAILTAAPAAVPNDSVIVVASGPQAAELANRVKEGDAAELKLETTPPMPNLLHSLGGGPWLVKGGQTLVTSEAERFTGKLMTENTPEGRAPRTAVGLTAEGKLLLVVIDGRRPYFSYGATLLEAAAVMKQLGAVDAINFDGGGSTTLVVSGQVVNSPSGGTERRVTNALVVKAR